MGRGTLSVASQTRRRRTNRRKRGKSSSLIQLSRAHVMKEGVDYLEQNTMSVQLNSFLVLFSSSPSTLKFSTAVKQNMPPVTVGQRKTSDETSRSPGPLRSLLLQLHQQFPKIRDVIVNRVLVDNKYVIQYAKRPFKYIYPLPGLMKQAQ